MKISEPQEPHDYRALAYYRQSQNCRYLIENLSLRNCCRALQKDQSQVIAVKAHDRAKFKHLQTCKRVWLCPVCAYKLARIRRDQLTHAIYAEKLIGFDPVMLTYTVQHHLGESLAVVRDRLLKARRIFHSGATWTGREQKYGWDGSVRSLELTYTANGWHFHVHELAFIRPQTDLSTMKGDLDRRWDACCKSVGAWQKTGHGLDLRAGDDQAGDYIKKWGLVPELIAGSVKQARAGGLLPFQFADLVLHDRARFSWARDRFREYAAATEGLRQLQPGRNLKALFRREKADPEPGDELVEIAASWTLDEWREALRHESRPSILARLEQADS